MKKQNCILLIIIAIGVFLRLFGIWNFSFMHDELSVINRLHFDTFSELIDKGIIIDGHPAGIQVFLWFWIKLFGISELSLRFPFIVMGILCIPLMYILTKKWFNETAGLFTAAIVSVSQYTIIYSLIARPYIAGLFFVLLLLIVWTKMLLEGDFRWRNILFFGIFAATSAYIHHFSMLTAFLIALIGFLFTNKNNILKYLSACFLGLVLYMPHFPILLYQIGVGGLGFDGWLASPKPSFVCYYFKYLFHFSWITGLGIVFAFILSSKINKEQWMSNKVKIGIAILLFVTPFVIGYLYSSYVSPVLQFSSLIFSFPFLLLLAAAFIDSKRNIIKIISLFIVILVMVFSLISTREHYHFLDKQWYEKSISLSKKWMEKQGNDNVDCFLRMSKLSISYYERKKNISLHNHFHSGDEIDEFSFQKKIETLESNFLIAAGLSDVQLEIIKLYYPILLEYEPCFTSEIYVFGKVGTNIEGMLKSTRKNLFLILFRVLKMNFFQSKSVTYPSSLLHVLQRYY